MDGIINVLKPPGMTSFDVVGHLRKVLKMKKIGHTGTLDPAVAGVLPICIGNATKAIEYIIDKDKLYRAELTLGISTDTQDSSGEIIAALNVDKTTQQIKDVIQSFVGDYKQIPPMYSAVKVNGRKLYELAREGIAIERKPREVKIYSIGILNLSPSKNEVNMNCVCGDNDSNNSSYSANIRTIKVLFDVSCSKGTYIRTLCSDIGEKLGCGGHMSFLIRLKAGTFEISNALLLEEISALARMDRLHEKIVKTDEIFRSFRRVVLDFSEKKKFMNGVFIKLQSHRLAPETGSEAAKKTNSVGITQADVKMVRVYDENDNFIALGELLLDNQGLELKSKKSFWSEENNESNLR